MTSSKVILPFQKIVKLGSQMFNCLIGFIISHLPIIIINSIYTFLLELLQITRDLPCWICWSLSGGHRCLIAGSSTIRWLAVICHAGFAGSRAGTVCLIAWSSTVRLPPRRIRWSLSGGYCVPDRRKHDHSPAGHDSPCRICRSPSGGHRVPDRWDV
jgi:hypothetical protein